MKKIFFQLGMLCLAYTSLAQNNPPSTLNTNLRLYLEVLNNPGSFIPGSSASYTPGQNPAIWNDQSNSGTSVQTFLSTALPQNNPQFIPNSNSTGFAAVRFNESIMENRLSPFTPPFTGTEATLFVVRIANTGDQQTRPLFDNLTNRWLIMGGYQSILSIAEPTANGMHDEDNEFGIGSDIALHHSETSQFTYRNQQCFGAINSPLPSDEPVALCARLGTSPQDIDYWVNGVISTEPILEADMQSPAVNYTQVNPPVGRRWVVGGRFNDGNIRIEEYFEGDILEILAYNRRLTDAEVDMVNNYLKCKYEINYEEAMCNLPVNCDCIYELDGNTVVALTAAMNVNYTGLNGNGECTFTATATATLGAGWVVSGYEWDIPGAVRVTTTSNATTDTQTFTLPMGTNADDVTVRILAYNTNYSEHDSHWCCNQVVTTEVWCNGGTGGTN